MGNKRQLSILIPLLGFGRAGGYRVLSKLADEWISHGCRVAFLVPYWSDLPYYPTKAEIHWVDARGGEVENRPQMEFARTMFGKIRKMFRSLSGLKRGIHRITGPWDIVLANHSLTAWPVALACTQGAKVYYIQAYEPEFYEVRRGLNNLVLKWASWVSYFLPLYRIVNAPLYLHYRACRARNWIPPGLDLDVFHPANKADSCEVGMERLAFTVGCIGRPEHDKGTKLAIEAYCIFAKNTPGLHRFRIANFGVPSDWLQGVPGLECVVPGNDVELANYYRSVNVILALGTQQHGAHHYPVLESMAAGVSVITTGYTPADASNAWIVGSNPIDASAALVDVYTHPDSGKLKRQRAVKSVQPYAWQHVGAQFLSEFVSLNRGRRVIL